MSMLRFRSLAVAVLLSTGLGVHAQDLSNRGLMEIKEKSEALRINWMKAFDDAVQAKNFSALAAIRQENELFLDKHLGSIRRLYAEGDGRALLTAVSNYLQIERQFVRDAMLPAEKLTASNQEGIDKTYQKITDFGQKERVFLVEINNALATEGENAGPSAPAQADPEMEQDEEYKEPKGSIIEGRPKRNKGKLPHEQMQDGKHKKKNKNASESEEY